MLSIDWIADPSIRECFFIRFTSSLLKNSTKSIVFSLEKWYP